MPIIALQRISPAAAFPASLCTTVARAPSPRMIATCGALRVRASPARKVDEERLRDLEPGGTQRNAPWLRRGEVPRDEPVVRPLDGPADPAVQGCLELVQREVQRNQAHALRCRGGADAHLDAACAFEADHPGPVPVSASRGRRLSPPVAARRRRAPGGSRPCGATPRPRWWARAWCRSAAAPPRGGSPSMPARMRPLARAPVSTVSSIIRPCLPSRAR